ncbi:MAG: SulP family inorganic anion transporter [Rhizobiaceae bacterium]|nr:SulP family inorganic anion transporter [Rhizobiaceae bacterium]
MAIAAVGLPSAIAYPAIAGLPAEAGLYASILAVVGYGVFGPSRRLIMGPDAATMIMLAAVLAKLPSDAIAERITTASAIALVVGGFCLLARLLRLDMVASFLSRPILIGFMTGISLSILVGQIGRFTGVSIEAEGIFLPFAELAGNWRAIQVPTLVLATSMLALLLIMSRVRFPVPGPVVVVVLSVVLSWTFGFADLGIEVVGHVPNSFPSFAVPWPLPIGIDQLIVDSLAVWLVSFSAGVVTARAFGARGNYRVDAKAELTGFASANIASGFFSGFPVTSSDSRTAINFSVGGKTQVAGLASAVALLSVLLFLNDLLSLLPVPALGAILAAAAIGLMDMSGLRNLWRVSRVEFVFAIVGLFAPVMFGVLTGVILAIGATLAYLLYRGMTPRVVQLGRVADEPGLYKLHRVKGAQAIPGLVVVLVQDSFLFYNADHVRRDIEELAEARSADLRWLVLDASSIPFMDTTAAATLVQIKEELSQRDVKFGIADVHSESLSLLRAAGVIDALGEDMVFDSIEDMLEAFEQSRRQRVKGPIG